MRCLTLAQRARARGVRVEFLCRDLPGALIPEVGAQGFPVHVLPADTADELGRIRSIADTATVDWMVVDHYGIDLAWERALRPAAQGILVIDDLANRAHDCDILVDQNYWPDAEHRYDGLLPADCLRLLGPRYLLLRDEFFQARAPLQRSFGPVHRLLVNFGGTDEPNVTCLALKAIAELNLSNVTVDAVIGASNPHRSEVEKRLSRLPRGHLHVQASNMATLIAQADIAIGACGSTTWERCYLGLPSIVLVLAENQRLAAEQLAQGGVLVSLGGVQGLDSGAIGMALQRLILDPGRRSAMAQRGMALLPQTQQDWTDMMLARGTKPC
jgi:UDP-2,4-diacetamido-2,4,6-trideoxy-beta-L-altropyranose hydrolase